jgi:hypothetical protein
MKVRDQLERLKGGVYALPQHSKESFLCWAAAVAGVPLGTEANFDELSSRITALGGSTAMKVLEDLETGLETVEQIVEVKDLPGSISGSWTRDHFTHDPAWDHVTWGPDNVTPDGNVEDGS